MESTSTPATSPLLRLPAELRNKIYAYVFDTPDRWVFNFRPATVTCTPEPACTQRFATFLALTKTCRQIRAETYLLAWERCFWEYNCIGSLPNFLRWCKKAEPRLRLLAWESMLRQ